MPNLHTYSVPEAAEVLQIHTTTLEKLIAAGELPAGRIGKKYILRVSDVHRYADELINKQTAQRLTTGLRPKTVHSKLKRT